MVKSTCWLFAWLYLALSSETFNTVGFHCVKGFFIYINYAKEDLYGIFENFLLVLIAEIGDKTQLMCMAFASRYKVRDVAIGVGTAIILLNGIAVALGSLLGSIIPFNYIKIVAALCFIAFGLWTIKDKEDDENEDIDKKTNLGPIITIASTFFIAELGDKTQLMTLTLSANFKQPVLVLLGSVMGMFIADSLGIVGAAYLKKYVPDVFMKWATAIIFLYLVQ